MLDGRIACGGFKVVSQRIFGCMSSNRPQGGTEWACFADVTCTHE
jgi:hypothetical protein